jgi:hypothetical protein
VRCAAATSKRKDEPRRATSSSSSISPVRARTVRTQPLSGQSRAFVPSELDGGSAEMTPPPRRNP